MAIVDVDGSSLSGLEKKLSLKKGFQVFRFLKVFLGFFVQRPNKYDTKAHEKHPMLGTPYLTKDKSPVSEEEHHVKNEDEIDECHKSRLKF